MNKKLNLAFCLFKYFPFGGLQVDFMQISKICLDRGHKVDVYTISWNGEKPEGFLRHARSTDADDDGC